MQKEELVLSRIRVENGMFSICQDEQMSMNTREKMLDHPWLVPLQDLILGTEGEVQVHTADTPELDTVLPPRLGCENDMEQLASNKDITAKIPPDTRFRFFKRVLNRLFRLTNRYQEIYNNAAFRVLTVLTGTLEWVKDGLAMTDAKANRALTMAAQQTEKANALKMQIQSLESKIQQMQNASEQRALSMERNLEQRMRQIEDAFVARDQITQELQNQSRYCLETLGSHSFQLNQASQKLDGLMNQANYNSEQLEKQNFRIRSMEAWVERAKYMTGESEDGVGVSKGGSYAQSGEDRIVDYLMERFQILPSEVTYLDLGANHAKYLSNTYYFYQKMGHGVLVEANPQLIPELERERERDTVLNRCVAPNSGEYEKLFILSGDGLSSPDRESVEEAIQQTPGLKLNDTVMVETISVNDLFRDYFEECPSFVSMDIEGMEMDILSSIDFEAYRPLVYIIETIPYSANLVTGRKEMEIVDFMKSKEYDEYAFTGINSIFVDRRRLRDTDN